MSEMRDTIEKIGASLEQFKATHDERLDSVVKRMDQMETRSNRPGIGGEMARANPAERKAFNHFIRTGDARELKAMTAGVAADGGYAVPEFVDRNIEKQLLDLSPIRQIANVLRVGTHDAKRLVNKRGLVSGWVAETASRPTTDAPQFAEVDLNLGEIYANPQASQILIDDAFFDLGAWLSDEISEAFAIAEGAAFVSGNGVDKPKGFLAYATAATADATRDFGTLMHIATGVADNWPATDEATLNKLFDVVYSLKAGYRANAHWVFNSNVAAKLSKLRDSNKQLLWQPAVTQGQPAMLLGYPVTIAEDMPDVAANALPVAFGDFRKGYTVADHVVGTRLLVDPFTSKPFVSYYVRRRVGGALIDSNAIRVLKVATA